MLDSDEVERRISEMLLDVGDEQLARDLVESLRAWDERDQRISDTLDELLLEVDRLLLKVDEIEGESLESEAREGENPCIR